MNESESKPIKEKLENLEAKLIEQEHRTLASIKNLIDNSSNKKFKRAAWISILTNLIFSKNSVIVIGSLGIGTAVSIFLAYQANRLVNEQNKLVKVQNSIIEQQSHLQEAERRSSYIFLMSNILDNLESDLKTESTISETTQSRLIALSSALKPYKYLDKDSLTDYKISIEKGYLFKTLINLNVPSSLINPILSKSDFRYTDLAGIRSTRNDTIDEINLSNSYFNESLFTNSIFKKINCFDCKIYNSEIDNIEVHNFNCEDCDINDAVFKKINSNYKQPHQNIKSSELSWKEKENIRQPKFNFKNITIRNSKFKDINLKNFDFWFAEIKNTHFCNCNFPSNFFFQSDIDSIFISSDTWEKIKDFDYHFEYNDSMKYIAILRSVPDWIRGTQKTGVLAKDKYKLDCEVGLKGRYEDCKLCQLLKKS